MTEPETTCPNCQWDMWNNKCLMCGHEKDVAKPEPVQVSVKEFLAAIKDKEEFVGMPMIWAEWPEKEKNA
jgi:uncharacterized Fe-S cluster-containing MiaB family protein